MNLNELSLPRIKYFSMQFFFCIDALAFFTKTYRATAGITVTIAIVAIAHDIIYTPKLKNPLEFSK